MEGYVTVVVLGDEADLVVCSSGRYVGGGRVSCRAERAELRMGARLGNRKGQELLANCVVSR